ncbi:unnamed protein product [Linum trigynum]|uniref:Uncharacterized protein n=1 Tax=Linum trigynum TaxID=586398 RepID=A0AAV2E9Z6_9ROSI
MDESIAGEGRASSHPPCRHHHQPTHLLSISRNPMASYQSDSAKSSPHVTIGVNHLQPLADSLIPPPSTILVQRADLCRVRDCKA